ncbi:hypothetical protein ACHAPT_008113 [Fusarium lateritium]
MPAPGSDFLDSLNQLFSEAGSKGRDGKIEFAHLRGILINFVAACSRMTAAKVRASCSLKFIDGTEPQTLLALPPGKLRIDDKLRAFLEAATTGAEFVEILRDMITKQLSPRQSPRGHKKRNPRQSPPASPKSKAQRRAEAAQKLKKQVVRLKLRRSGERLGADEKAQQIMTQTESSEAGGESQPVVDQQALPQVISEPGDAPNLPGPMDIDASHVDSNKQMDPPESISDNPSSEGDHSVSSFDNEGDTQMEDAIVPKIEETPENEWPPRNHVTPAQRRIDIRELTTAIAQCDGDGWETLKPQLLDMLAQINYVNEKANAPPTPETVAAALKRLDSGVAKLEPEKAYIPAKNWEKYHAKLIKEAKAGWFDKPWDDRQWRICRICYLKEEDAVIVNRDWDRLRAAARMCAILIELTAPPWEPVDRETGDKWLIEKLGDVSFLERLFNCKDRVAAIRGPGEK